MRIKLYCPEKHPSYKEMWKQGFKTKQNKKPYI